MKKKIKIQNTIYWSIVVTLIFTALFIFICIFNQKQFHSFQESSQQYVLCKDSVEQLEEGCDYLVEQARLYAMTGNEYYMDLYFREAHMTKRREHALKQLEEYFDGTQTFTSLKSALKSSGDLMSIDYYSMRLIADANSKIRQDGFIFPTCLIHHILILLLHSLQGFSAYLHQVPLQHLHNIRAAAAESLRGFP